MKSHRGNWRWAVSAIFATEVLLISQLSFAGFAELQRKFESAHPVTADVFTPVLDSITVNCESAQISANEFAQGELKNKSEFSEEIRFLIQGCTNLLVFRLTEVSTGIPIEYTRCILAQKNPAEAKVTFGPYLRANESFEGLESIRSSSHVFSANRVFKIERLDVRDKLVISIVHQGDKTLPEPLNPSEGPREQVEELRSEGGSGSGNNTDPKVNSLEMWTPSFIRQGVPYFK